MVADNSSSTDSQSAKSGTNKTAIIVGVVVGVGGALILTGLALWLLRRHKAKKREEETKAGATPYVVSEKELYRTASWSPHNADGTAPSANAEARPRDSDEVRPPRRIVREQDAEEYEVLPPLYREWQPRPGPEGDSSPSQAPPPESHPADTPSGLSDSNVDPISLKDDYVRALGSSAGPSSVTSPPQPARTPKGGHATELSANEEKCAPERPGTSPPSQDNRPLNDEALLPNVQRRSRALPEIPTAGASNDAGPVAAPVRRPVELARDYKRAFL